MTTYLDYQNRTVDVAAFRGAVETGETRLTQSLADDASGGEVCTGAHMVAQCWLTEFLTEEGSVPYDPAAGCGFMAAARQGRFLSEADVYQFFNLSAAKVRRNLAKAEDPAEPAEDRFASAELTGVTVAPGAAALRVTVRTRAGTARKVVVPIPIAV